MKLPEKGCQVSLTRLKHLALYHKQFDIYEKLICGDMLPPRPFRSDGCSFWPDWVGGDLYPACFWHDVRYWLGGSEADREGADRMLRADVLAVTGNEALADIMYNGVRIGGRPGTGLPWQWGYGWSAA